MFARLGSDLHGGPAVKISESDQASISRRITRSLRISRPSSVQSQSGILKENFRKLLRQAVQTYSTILRKAISS